MSDPIEVSASQVPEQLTSAIRQVILGVGAWLVGRGWMDSATAGALVPLLMIGVPFAWSRYSVWKKHQKMVVMADAAPADVANVR